MRIAALLLIGGVAVLAPGCGGASGESATSRAALKLEREDLLAVSHALQGTESSTATEVAATKTAWPLIAKGLPAGAAASARQPIRAAAESAARIKLPALFEEAKAISLTGPAAELAGLFRTFAGLVTRGWELTSAAIDARENASPKAARFARENVGLYIESIYDGHFDLAQIGKQLADGYRKLGGPAAFAGVLSQAEVDALVRFYSEPAARLHPHVGVRLGS